MAGLEPATSLKNAHRFQHQIDSAEELCKNGDETERRNEQMRVSLAILSRLTETRARIECLKPRNIGANVNAEIGILALHETEDAVFLLPQKPFGFAQRRAVAEKYIQ
jgi:hypothetical protein